MYWFMAVGTEQQVLLLNTRLLYNSIQVGVKLKSGYGKLDLGVGYLGR